MNKLMIIGNLTRDPELRTTPTGKNVCTFTVAVNRRKKVNGQPDADFFRVSAWDATGELCAKYLSKGRKVCIIGAVTAHAYTTSKGEAAASLEVTANEVEFLSSAAQDQQTQTDQQSGMQVVEPENLPF